MSTDAKLGSIKVQSILQSICIFLLGYQTFGLFSIVFTSSGPITINLAIEGGFAVIMLVGIVAAKSKNVRLLQVFALLAMLAAVANLTLNILDYTKSAGKGNKATGNGKPTNGANAASSSGYFLNKGSFTPLQTVEISAIQTVLAFASSVLAFMIWRRIN